MKFSPNKKKRVKELSGICADLLVDIIEEDLPLQQVPTEKDSQFIEVISEIRSICPSLSYSYVLMYNQIQKDKINGKSEYLKRIRTNLNPFSIN